MQFVLIYLHQQHNQMQGLLPLPHAHNYEQHSMFYYQQRLSQPLNGHFYGQVLNQLHLDVRHKPKIKNVIPCILIKN